MYVKVPSPAILPLFDCVQTKPKWNVFLVFINMYCFFIDEECFSMPASKMKNDENFQRSAYQACEKITIIDLFADKGRNYYSCF